MDTTENAVSYLNLHKTPHWTLFSGSTKVGESDGSDNLEDSITRFRETMQLLPSGSYKLLCAKNPKDNRGGLTCTFSKGQTSSASPANPMQAAPSSNIFGVPDATYAHLQAQFEQAFIMKQMYQWFQEFSKEWPEYKKKIDILYEDEDGDGTPDFMQMAKTASDTMNSVKEVSKAFEGGKAFRF